MLRQSEREHESLCAEHTATEDYRVDLAEVRRSLGNIARILGQDEAAVSYFEQAQPAIDAKRHRDPNDVHARDVYVSLHQFQSQLRCRLGRHKDALIDYDCLLRLGSGSSRDEAHASARRLPGASRRPCPVRRRSRRRREGPHDPWRQAALLAGVRFFPGGSGRAGRCHSESGRPCRALTSSYRAALACLQKAGADGYFRDAKNRKTLDEDSNLDPFRQHADFRTWVLTLASAPAPPP